MAFGWERCVGSKWSKETSWRIIGAVWPCLPRRLITGWNAKAAVWTSKHNSHSMWMLSCNGTTLFLLKRFKAAPTCSSLLKHLWLHLQGQIIIFPSQHITQTEATGHNNKTSVCSSRVQGATFLLGWWRQDVSCQFSCSVWTALASVEHPLLAGSGWHWHSTQTDMLSEDKQHSELSGFACETTQNGSNGLHLVCLCMNCSLFVNTEPRQHLWNGPLLCRTGLTPKVTKIEGSGTTHGEVFLIAPAEVPAPPQRCGGKSWPVT